MNEGDSASYGHVHLHSYDEYEHGLRVIFECLDRRSFENRDEENVQQWHFEVALYDRTSSEDVATEEIVVSIAERSPVYSVRQDNDGPTYKTIVWVADENPRRSLISATTGLEQPEYPWAVNHDDVICDYSRYGGQETITSAVLSVLEDIHLVF